MHLFFGGLPIPGERNLDTSLALQVLRDARSSLRLLHVTKGIEFANGMRATTITTASY